MTTKTEVKESSGKEFRSVSSEERAIFNQIASGERPYSQRAQALLAIDGGATQAEAASATGLTKGQVRYWLTKFRRDRTDIFPEELLNQAQQDAESPQSSAEDQPDLADAEETVGPVDAAKAQLEDTPQAKKKSRKKPKKKAKKAKKSVKKKKQKKDKKVLKGKKSKKKNKKGKSKKAKVKKSKPSKKKRKK